MEVTILQAVGIGLVALFAYMVDTFAYAQWDRPIFTCLLVGLVLGDLEQALILGANLELLYMGTMSIGAALPPDANAPGILLPCLMPKQHPKPPASMRRRLSGWSVPLPKAVSALPPSPM